MPRNLIKEMDALICRVEKLAGDDPDSGKDGCEAGMARSASAILSTRR